MIQATGKHVTLGDLIGCILKDSGRKIEGYVIYDYDDESPTPKMCILTSAHVFYEFKDIQDFWVIQPSPFHQMVENAEPEMLFPKEMADYLNKQGSHSVKESNGSDEQGKFTCQFGEPACIVFERWGKELNRLMSEYNLLKEVVNKHTNDIAELKDKRG